MRSKRAMASSTFMLSPLSARSLSPKALWTIGIEDLHTSSVHDFHGSQLPHQWRKCHSAVHESKIQVRHWFGISQYGKTIARHWAISNGHREGPRASQGGQVVRRPSQKLIGVFLGVITRQAFLGTLADLQRAISELAQVNFGARRIDWWHVEYRHGLQHTRPRSGADHYTRAFFLRHVQPCHSCQGRGLRTSGQYHRI